MAWKLVLTGVLAALGGLLMGLFLGSPRSGSPRGSAGDEPKVVLVIHGGAGVLDEAEMKDAGTKPADYEEALAAALRAGWEGMRQGTSVDGVELAIRSMEDSPLFNAGKGAALSADGMARLDAAIMEGRAGPPGNDSLGKRDPRKRAGSVADVLHIKNPISAARAVMEMEGQRHVLLVGDGAEAFALTDANRKRFHLERVSNDYFYTPWREKLLRDARAREKGRADGAGPPAAHFGTVGAVARKGGTLAAGTSTGGLTNKLPGRVGDTPLIGSGTYADDRACAVSCTGTGEVFIRHAVAHDVVARMLYSRPQPSVAEAGRQAIDSLPDEEGGVGSLIALDVDGNHVVAMSERLAGTYRGYVTTAGEVFVGTVKGPMKSMGRLDVGPGQE